MPHTEIGEDKIASTRRTFEIGSASNADASKNRQARRAVVDFARSDRTGDFERSVQHEARVVAECDVFTSDAIPDVERNDWWRVYRTSVGGGWEY